MKRRKPIYRPRVSLPRNLMVTQVVENKRGRGAYNRQESKKISLDE